MKPVTKVMRVKSNFQGATATMAIDGKALIHIMGVLSNLYTDPIAAVVREYSTNAYDATIEAGTGDPIQVTLPTTIKPVFSVEDFGVGMSTERILDHYSLYGRSDKRDSNAVVGMLGLGCKSALTYSDSFTVTSRHNGVETVAMIVKNEQGVGEIQIVDTRSTDRRNGTTVTIPVNGHDVDDFQTTAAEFFGYWDAGTVLLDGKAPVSAFAEFSQIPGTEVWQRQGYSASHTVLMGNVPYEVRSEILKDFYGSELIIRAEIGDVSFAPSREELYYNDTTNRFLRNVAQNVRQNIQDEVNSVLANATTGTEAYNARAEFGKYSFLSNIAWVWNGKDVPERLTYNYNNPDAAFLWENGWNGADGRITRSWRLWSSNMANTIFISGYKGKSLPIHIKHGLIALSKDENSVLHGAQRFLFSKDRSVDYGPWVEFIEWSDISADIPKPTSPGKNSTGTRNSRSGKVINDEGDVSDSVHTPSPKNKYLVLGPKDFTAGDRIVTIGNKSVRISTIHQAGIIPICVYVRDQAGFCEEWSTVTIDDVLEWVKQEQENIADSIYLNAAIYRTSASFLIGADLDDPALTFIAESVKHTADLPDGVSLNPVKITGMVRTVQAALAPYGSVIRAYSVGDKSRIEIINALYHYRKDGNNE